MDKLWDAVVRKCLQRAEILLDRETAPTAETVEAVRGLVEMAVAISDCNRLPVGPGTVYAFKDGKVKKKKISNQSSSSFSGSG